MTWTQYFVLGTQSFPTCLLNNVKQQHAKLDVLTIVAMWWFGLAPFWWSTCGVSHESIGRSIITSHLTSMHLTNSVHTRFFHEIERGQTTRDTQQMNAVQFKHQSNINKSEACSRPTAACRSLSYNLYPLIIGLDISSNKGRAAESKINDWLVIMSVQGCSRGRSVVWHL